MGKGAIQSLGEVNGLNPGKLVPGEKRGERGQSPGDKQGKEGGAVGLSTGNRQLRKIRGKNGKGEIRRVTSKGAREKLPKRLGHGGNLLNSAQGGQQVGNPQSRPSNPY